MMYDDEAVARVVHEANRALQHIQGDPAPSVAWDDETPHVRDTAISGVSHARAGMSPRELHDHWLTDKRAAGWTYGEVKDPVAKKHPCVVAYDDLPVWQRHKDDLFTAIVGVLDDVDRPERRPRNHGQSPTC